MRVELKSGFERKKNVATLPGRKLLNRKSILSLAWIKNKEEKWKYANLELKLNM